MQVTTQMAGGGLITETVTRVGGSIVPGYIHGPGENGAGVQVSVVEQTREVRELEGDVFSPCHRNNPNDYNCRLDPG